MRSFAPGPTTVNINVSSSSQVVALAPGASFDSVRIENDGSATVWIAFGGSSAASDTSSGEPIPAGVVEVQTLPPGTTHIAAIAASTTGKIYFTPGNGI